MAVSVEKALELIYKNSSQKTSLLLPIEETLGLVLAQDIVAHYNLPAFDNSAMDGYAIQMAHAGESVEIRGTIFAGDNKDITLDSSFCVKIMTGAPIPEGCEAVVPAEDTTMDADKVKFSSNIRKFQHIRRAGEDIKEDEVLLQTGQRLYAHHISLLASQGISHIRVCKKPRVALFASGHELKMHFEQVEDYQLYNTNTPTILSRAQELGCETQFIGTAEDNLESINEHIASALDSDLIITSGGVSVGEADFTKEAFAHFDYENIFDGIIIKPGKPTVFGRIGKTYVLNLPGNPLAAALIFELFGKSIILALSGAKEKYLGSIETKMSHDFSTKPGRITLIPGYFDGKSFTVCDKFAPGMVSPLAKSNGYILKDAETKELQEGALVKFIPTRFSMNTSKTDETIEHLLSVGK